MKRWRIGLVNRLYPPDQLREQTYAYARDLADMVSPSAIAVIKRQLYDVPFQTLAEATIDANREMVVALRGSDFREGVASFVEKRAPRLIRSARRRPSGLWRGSLRSEGRSVVEPGGIEPPTSSLRTTRSPS